MSPERRDAPHPPEPPEIPRRVQLPPSQLIGIPLMLLVPVLALAGVFGESREAIHQVGPDLDVRAEYPTRYRYKMSSEIQVAVRNVSGRTIDTVSVAFDPAYISQFSEVTFLPAAGHGYEVVLTDLGAGGTRLATVELRAERYGRHDGRIMVTAGGADTVSIAVRTTIFP